MSTITNTKEALAQAKTRMEKAVEDFRKELASAAHRARQRHDPGPYSRGLPRHADAGESAWALSVPEPMMIRDFAVGSGCGAAAR